MTPEQFKLWQISHYTQRLSEETRTEAKAFLRAELYRLKQNKND